MSIEREFIPYEQALALKELGFDEPCFGYWSNWAVQEPFLLTCELGKEIESASINRKNILFKAPTFSQAFRWFREKYKISGEISSNFYLEGKDNEWEYNIYQLGKEDDGYDGTIPIYKTYEETELECLKKLIEIVKEK